MTSDEVRSGSKRRRRRKNDVALPEGNPLPTPHVSDATGSGPSRVVVKDLDMTGGRSRSGSPEIPSQITNLTVNVPSGPPHATPPPSSHKPKRRKTLESVLTSIMEQKLSRNGDISPDEPFAESSRQGPMRTKAAEVGGSKKYNTRKRKTLFGKRAREKSEAFKLSVVADEVSFTSQALV